MPLTAAKAFITVTAGVIQWDVMPEYTKSWGYSSDDYGKDCLVPQDRPTIFSKMLDEAHEYAKGLSNPAHVNWTRVDWIWV